MGRRLRLEVVLLQLGEGARILRPVGIGLFAGWVLAGDRDGLRGLMGRAIVEDDDATVAASWPRDSDSAPGRRITSGRGVRAGGWVSVV